MGKKIMIIEDEIIVANDIKQILLISGFNVIGVSTKYDQSVIQINKLKPDLIICDINLQGEKSGIDLIQELSGKYNFTVIFISAYSDIETIKNANLVNPFNYIVKPFNDQQLITSVRLALLSSENQVNIEKPSKRELEIIKFLAKGMTNDQIGKELFISDLTVKTHRSNLLRKYNMKNTTELIALSIKQKWI